jgi:ABC-2 type transport system ATP-binding protein
MMESVRRKPAPGAEWAIEAAGLVKAFGARRVVDGVSLRVRPGTIFAVLGPNGAGKTTTLRMLSTLLKPDGGTATIFGLDVVKRAHAVRELIGVTGQYASLDESLTAFENLVLFACLLGLGRREARLAAAELVDRFGLAEAAHRPLKQFSGGMKRRLDLAASLIVQPPLLFLDEPTTGLDPATRTNMWHMIRRMVEGGSTVLLTTQYLEEADQLAGRIAVIDRGRVVAEGTPDELKASVGASSLRLKVRFMHDLADARLTVEHVLGGRSRLTAEGRTIVAPVNRADQLADLLAALRQRGIAVEEISVQKPTLDEVFMAVTGHAAGDRESGPPASEPAGGRSGGLPASDPASGKEAMPS